MKYLAVTLGVLAAGACGGGGAARPTTPELPAGAVFTTLRLSPASGSVEIGGTFQLTATATDAAGNAIDGLPAPAFTSSDPAKATVDGSGAVTGIAAGPVVISAVLSHGGVTDTATTSLTVVPRTATFASLAVTPDVGLVQVGAALQLAATPRDAGGVPVTGLPAASFSTSDATRATVDGSGMVRGVAAGPVTITASLSAGGVTRQATASITVVEPVATSAAVQARRSGYSPASVTVAAAGTVTWTMVDDDHDVTFSGPAPDGGSIPRTDEGVSVSRTFTTAGTYAYHCDRHDGDESGTVVVRTGEAPNPVFTSLTLTPASGSVAPGATLQLTATPRDQNGAPMGGLGTATFSSSAAGTATVSATGVVTGVATGSATITASLTAGGVTRTATATVTVTTTPPPPSTATVRTSGASFTPQSVTINPGGSVTWQMQEDRHNVTFSGAAPTGGNVPDTNAGGTATRTFPNAGTYDYVCTRHNGMSGRVVVQ